jgi:hypothetical protein
MSARFACSGCSALFREPVPATCEWCSRDSVPHSIKALCVDCGRSPVQSAGDSCTECHSAAGKLPESMFWFYWRKRWGDDVPEDPDGVVPTMVSRYDAAHIKSSIHSRCRLADISEHTDRLDRGISPDRGGFGDDYFSDGEMPRSPPRSTGPRIFTQNYSDDT